ncbi:hypothetical protein QL093DRAFT_2330154 [Fusarium oxysporum]|nr:hypothetical protein QL093DRAFT_2330154 [Fusarium oxysporum]
MAFVTLLLLPSSIDSAHVCWATHDGRPLYLLQTANAWSLPSYIPVRHHHLRLGIWTPQGIGVAADALSRMSRNTYSSSLLLKWK